MIINGKTLLQAAPIKDMLDSKQRFNGISYGLSEAGYDIRVKQDLNFGHMTLWGKAARFQLASAIEEFQMPDNLVAIVHDKSSLARQGVSVFNTVIEPGWKGFLTLEIVYHGNSPIRIPAGTGIAQVIFHQVKEPASYDGKYQNQADMPVAAKFEF